MQTLQDAFDLAGKTDWLWPGWLAKGYVTLLAGRKGMGKSTLALDLFGRSLLQGKSWPDGKASVIPPSDTFILWLEAEAGHQINANRAIGLGVDLSRLQLFDPPYGISDPYRHFSATPEALEWVALTASSPSCLGVVVDALSGTHNADENSAKLGKLGLAFADIAQKTSKPVLLLHHKSKRGRDRDGKFLDDSLESVRGTSALVQYTRVVISLDAPLGDNIQPYRMSQFVNNLTVLPEPIGYYLGDNLSYTDAPSPREESSSSSAAEEWLAKILADGAVAAVDILAAAKDIGFSERTLRRAKSKLGVKAEQINGIWVWKK